MGILSLLTDFGTEDGFVGVMKAVIWGINPQVKISDISHAVQAQNVFEGALILSRTAPFFPTGSVHVAVIDPGVGTERRALAARLGSQLYVAPDNGLLTPLIQDAEKKQEPVNFVALDNPDYWLKHISGTFHGRDIFAPVGAHLAAGVPLETLGRLIDDPLRLDMPAAQKTERGWLASITLIDHFGNLRTNLKIDKVSPNAAIRVGQITIQGLIPAYGYGRTGEPAALADSGNYLEIAFVNDNAAKRLGVQVGDTVEIWNQNL